MNQQDSGLDQRLSELQAQIDQLVSSLHLWRQKEDQVQYDASERVQDLQRAIEHEWTALRQLHEEPVRQLREQAASLAEVSVAAATSAQRGFERAEARLAVLESDMHRGMAELSRDVQMAVAELRPRSDRPVASLTDGATAWPLEGVMRLHDQLRRSTDGSDGVAPASDRAIPGDHTSRRAGPTVSPPAASVALLPESTTALSDRLSVLEQALTDGQAATKAATERSDSVRWNWRVALIVFALFAAALVWQLQRQARSTAASVLQAENKAKIATDAANEQLSAARDEAAHQIATAREIALRAQMISDVLAASDTVRFNLTGGNSEARLSAQMFWSRSRGFVFSGSRLPPPPAGSTYQIWLATSADPVNAGVFVPDASGRITIATDSPPTVPRPVIDVMVTVEPAGGRQAPSGDRLLARATPRPPAP